MPLDILPLRSGGLTIGPMGHVPGDPDQRGPRAETYFFIHVPGKP